MMSSQQSFGKYQSYIETIQQIIESQNTTSNADDWGSFQQKQRVQKLSEESRFQIQPKLCYSSQLGAQVKQTGKQYKIQTQNVLESQKLENAQVQNQWLLKRGYSKWICLLVLSCLVIVLVCTNFELSNLLFGKIKNIELECPHRHVVTYIWLDSKKMPKQYSNYIEKCQKNVRLLRDQDFAKYIEMWNQEQPEHKIRPQDFPQKFPASVKATFLRKVYIYFQGGIYSDFDTVINETCFENAQTDQILFTNQLLRNQRGIIVPEQNFIMSKRLNPAVKRWIIAQVNEVQYSTGTRWDECQAKQCYILFCQKHRYDGSYNKFYWYW